MTTQTAPKNLAPPRRRFTREEYHRLGELGILKPDERVELIKGEVMTMAPIGSTHASTVIILIQLLTGLFRGQALVSVQNPIGLSDSEPQPDVSLLKPRGDHYRGAHPAPDDVLLVIEVADTSLGYDMGTKAPLYAESGIRELWVVDVNASRLHVFRGPNGKAFETVFQLNRGQAVAPLAFPTTMIPVEDILGPTVPAA